MSQLKTELILSQLRLGGLTLSERGTGKTTALLARAMEIATKEGLVIIAVCNSTAAGILEYRCRKEWPMDLRKPVIVWEREQLRGYRAAILVDEYFSNWFGGVGDGAVGTAPFPIHIATSI